MYFHHEPLTSHKKYLEPWHLSFYNSIRRGLGAVYKRLKRVCDTLHFYKPLKRLLLDVFFYSVPLILKTHQKTDIRYLLTLPRSMILASRSTRNWQDLGLFPAISDRFRQIAQRHRPENTRKRKQCSRSESTVPGFYDSRQIHKPKSNGRPRKTGQKLCENPLYPIRIRGGIKRIQGNTVRNRL